MFIRIETSKRLSYVMMDLEDITGIDYIDLWGGLPSPPYDRAYGQFWFTEFGWAQIGERIQNLLIKYDIDHTVRVVDILEVCYRDEFQVATPRR